MNLLEMQRDFRGWLTREDEAARSRLAPDAAAARAGFAVYLNNYRAQLMACLMASFPAVRTMLGEGAFDGVAARHIDEAPPHEWTLDDYPAEFATTLDRAFPTEPHVAELARLERALAVAFVGPDDDALDLSTLRDIDWEAAVLRLSTAFSLMPVTTNVEALWTAAEAQVAPPAAARLPETRFLVVWRGGFKARFRSLEPIEADVLAQVRDGARFGEICARLAVRLGAEAGTAAAGRMLGQWLADGLVVGISDIETDTRRRTG